MASVLKGGQQKVTQQVAGLSITDSVYGRAIMIIYGRARVSGMLIDYGNFQTHQGSGGGKGGKG